MQTVTKITEEQICAVIDYFEKNKDNSIKAICEFTGVSKRNADRVIDNYLNNKRNKL